MANADGRLKPGLFATARIEQAAKTPALLVPAAAVQKTATANRVFVVVRRSRRGAAHHDRSGRRATSSKRRAASPPASAWSSAASSACKRRRPRQGRELTPCSGWPSSASSARSSPGCSSSRSSSSGCSRSRGWASIAFPTSTSRRSSITTRLPGAAPEQIETEVTDKIEEAVNTISGIDTLTSNSSEGVSQVVVSFVLEKDANVAAQEVRDKINRRHSAAAAHRDPADGREARSDGVAGADRRGHGAEAAARDHRVRRQGAAPAARELGRRRPGAASSAAATGRSTSGSTPSCCARRT